MHGSGTTIDWSNPVNGLDAWAEKAVAGRGILVDYRRYAERNGLAYNGTQSHQITASTIQTILAKTKVTPQVGDILFIRTGFVAAYSALSQDERAALKDKREWPGLVQSRDSVEWLWQSQFAAVAADNPAFECGRAYSLTVQLRDSVLTVSQHMRTLYGTFTLSCSLDGVRQLASFLI